VPKEFKIFLVSNGSKKIIGVKLVLKIFYVLNGCKEILGVKWV